MKGFIPAESNEVGYIKQTGTGTSVVPAPALPGRLKGSCFETDNRDFSDSPTAPARVTVEFVLLVDGDDVGLERADGRDFRRIGETRNVDCVTGELLRKPRRADLGSVAVGPVKRSPALRVVNARASTADPFYAVAPRLDFEAVLQFILDTRTLNVVLSAGTFPSFEAYYRLNDGPVVPLVQWLAEGTAYTLFDFGTGVNTRSQQIEVSFETTHSDESGGGIASTPPDRAESPWAGAKRHIAKGADSRAAGIPEGDLQGVELGRDSGAAERVDRSPDKDDRHRDAKTTPRRPSDAQTPNREVDVEIRKAGKRNAERIRELQDLLNGLGPATPSNEGDTEFLNRDE